VTAFVSSCRQRRNPELVVPDSTSILPRRFGVLGYGVGPQDWLRSVRQHGKRGDHSGRYRVQRGFTPCVRRAASTLTSISLQVG